MAKKKTSKKSVAAKVAAAVKKTVKKAIVKDGSDAGIITPHTVTPVQPLPKKE